MFISEAIKQFEEDNGEKVEIIILLGKNSIRRIELVKEGDLNYFG